MTKPLALVCYEKLLPGSQLVNRFQDLGYRTHVCNDLSKLPAEAREAKPMVAVLDLLWRSNDSLESVRALRQDPSTAHLPIIAFAESPDAKLQDSALAAGATLLVNESAMISQLPHLLEQALLVE